ncbi:MAG: T9SS type A sorting domain-containing protein, partial [bacterium]|nr:T9SS type A sorting domain-containing protein [bacterium]
LPIVGDFQLGQCYPNPFNNNTVIPYVLYRQARLVKLSIYNTLGQKIAVFEDLNTAAGKYHVNWNTKNYIESEASSGIYYYELSVDEQKQTRKMIYLK